MTRKQSFARLMLAATILTSGLAASAGSSFYRGPALFSTRPSETKSLQSINRFGPVGIGIELLQPAFVMRVKNIEKGSPAEATGKLRKGQIIETINGQKLADIDPRFQLAKLITQAEATDGVLKFMVKDKPNAVAEEVIVKIPVLGAYSKAWPLKCPKSDKIVRNFADYLARHNRGGRGLNGPEILFLLSTGEEKDLDLVRQWLKGRRGGGNYAWHIGYEAVPVAEYYLRTGDKSILPAIQEYADAARKIYYCGGWAGRGTGNFAYMGGGHMNAAGTHVLTFLLLARECGVNVDEVMFEGALKQFYRFAGRGLNPYGDGRPESGFVDNGKCGILAFAMAAAASLTPDGEDSVYARAREVSALKSFYTTPWMLHGHTGGGIGEIWRSAAMGLMVDKRPKQYRDFMDSRRWWYELSRRYNGSFGVLGGGGYDVKHVGWCGVVMGLTYTTPRKTLQISGASRSKYAKPGRLPVRPWGTEADDRFLSLKPAVDKNGKSPAVNEETLASDSAMRILERLREDDVSEETVRSYAHHQDHAIRRAAAMCAAGMRPFYMFTKKSEKARYPGLVAELLKSKDPRVRWAGIYAVNALPDELLTHETFGLLAAMVNDPEESWWVVDQAMQALSKGKPEMIGPHVDRLLYWLEHEEWWLSSSALTALLPVTTDERYYAKIFPVLGRVIAANQRFNRMSPLYGFAGKLKEASPAVQKAANEMLERAYAAFPAGNPKYKEVPNVNGEQWHLKHIAAYLSGIPGGLDRLYEVSQKRFPEQNLAHREMFLRSGDLESNPKVKKVLTPLIMDELTAEYVGLSRAHLLKEAAAGVQSAFPQGRLDALTALYRKAGVRDYDWHIFADLRHAEWSYHTFDPIPSERVPWDQLITRYRDVTLPKGMENWFALDFDAEKAGWKRGQSAFGQWDGKIPEYAGPCRNPACSGQTEVKTLWDKEVLLMRGTFAIPRMKEGYRYRLRVNDGDHVGSGGGYAIYINGKRLIEQTRCAGRGQGARPKGAFITKEFLKDSQGGEVTIAAKSFLRFNHKYKVRPTTRIPQGRISFHFEEMKLPPLGPAEMVKSATVVPMLSTKWQEKQNEDDKELQSDDDRFLYDGKFVANPQVLGNWKIIDQVKTVDEFKTDKRMNPGRATIRAITFKDKGETDELLWIWSGDTLMDLARNQALKMTVKRVGDDDYLFVEAGGFSTRQREGWKTPYYVMKRVAGDSPNRRP